VVKLVNEFNPIQRAHRVSHKLRLPHNLGQIFTSYATWLALATLIVGYFVCKGQRTSQDVALAQRKKVRKAKEAIEREMSQSTLWSETYEEQTTYMDTEEDQRSFIYAIETDRTFARYQY